MIGLGTGEIIVIFILFAVVALVPLAIIIYFNIKKKPEQEVLPSSPDNVYLTESKLENLDYLRSRNLISATEYNKKREKIMNEL